MEVDESELSNRLLEIEYIRRELESYISGINTLQLTQETIQKSLDGLSRLGKNSKEIMISYSPEIFFKGTVSDTSTAIVNIGSNIFKKYDLKRLEEKLQGDMNEVSKNIEQMATIIQQLQERGAKIEQETSKLYEEYQNSLNK